jgi:hypothetical protein
MPPLALAEWTNLLAPGGFYSSPQWVSGLEAAHGPDPILTATVNGRLSGVLPTWTNHDHGGGLFGLAGLAAGLTGPWARPWLWAGTRRGTANAVLAVADPHPRAAAVRRLLQAARELAAARGLHGVVWPYLPGTAALEAASVLPGAQAVLHGADAVIPVPAGGMAALEQAATNKRRKEIRRERRIFRDAAGPVVWTGLTPETGALITPLLARTRDKYGATGGTGWIRRVIAGQLRAGTASSAVVALAATGGTMTTVTAAAVFYRHRSWLYGRYWGAGPGAPPMAYFALTMYEAVDWAAAHGCTHLHLSVPVTAAKTSRGAIPSPLGMVILPVYGPPVLDPGLLRAHNRSTALRWAGTGPLFTAAGASWRAWLAPTDRTGS